MRTCCAMLACLLVFDAVTAHERWVRTYGGTNGDWGASIELTTDGGYVICGSTSSLGAGGSDVYLIKIDSLGDTVWTRTYGGSSDDDGECLSQTADGGFIVVGYTNSYGSTTDIYIVKTNAAGDTLWTRVYAGAGADLGMAVRQTVPDLGYILTGYTSSTSNGDDDAFLIRTDSLGNPLWTRHYGGSGGDWGRDVELTSDGGFVLAGYTTSYGPGPYTCYVVKTDAAGDTLWTRTYGGAGGDMAECIQPLSDHGYVITGTTYTGAARGDDVYVVRTDSAGVPLLTALWGGPQNDEGYSIRSDGEGGYVIAGVTLSLGAGSDDVYLLRLSASLDTVWTRTFGGAAADVGYEVRPTPDSGYVVVGLTGSFGAGAQDVYAVKTDANGSAAVEEEPAGRPTTPLRLEVMPNPYASFARVLGHESGRFVLYDAAGSLVGSYPGSRVGEGLPAAVYFIRPADGAGGALRLVKVE